MDSFGAAASQDIVLSGDIWWKVRFLGVPQLFDLKEAAKPADKEVADPAAGITMGGIK